MAHIRNIGVLYHKWYFKKNKYIYILHISNSWVLDMMAEEK